MQKLCQISNYYNLFIFSSIDYWKNSREETKFKYLNFNTIFWMKISFSFALFF